MGHLVFDFDGTLINSMDFAYDAVQDGLEKKLGRFVGREEFERVFAAHHTETYQQLGIQSKEDQIELWYLWMENEKKIRHLYHLFPGVVQMFEALRSLGHTFYLWTARERDTALDLLKQMGMIDWFKDIRCGDDCPRKPDPTGLLQMLPDVAKEEVFMVGDSTMDIEGARHSGVRSIGVTWSRVTDEDLLRRSGADFIAKSPEICLQILLTEFR